MKIKQSRNIPAVTRIPAEKLPFLPCLTLWYFPACCVKISSENTYPDQQTLRKEYAESMKKVFNTTAVCIPGKHYMVNLDERLKEIKKMIDDGKYFTINRARQYGKTTTLMALSQYLQKEYHVVLIDFQTFGSADFSTEHVFSASFAGAFLESLDTNGPAMTAEFQKIREELEQTAEKETFTLRPLFKALQLLCSASDRPIVLMLDEVDSAADNQIFLDFLAQLRAQYITRFQFPTFQSVILASVYDIRNLKQKIRPDGRHKYNSPWNIAADFRIPMDFSAKDIAGMLREYEKDHHTRMDIEEMAHLLYEYTAGYPFLVSRLCQLLDEDIGPEEKYDSPKAAWTKSGFHRALRMILSEKNTLFESLIGKLHDYPELNETLRTLLFTGKTFLYRTDENVTDVASMFGFIKNQNGTVAIANRIFETRLYNYYLSEEEMQKTDIYKASLQDKSQFISGGYLNMRRILEKFVEHFHDIYGGCSEKFLEEEGRQYFLLYLKPIINGRGNYYIESRTRDLRRTDVIVDYHGEQYIIEMKIWHGEEYNHCGEQQLISYLEDYHISKGYMLSFNFNKNKTPGVRDIFAGEMHIIEAVV